MTNKTRKNDEYKSFNVYPEINFVKSLQGEELLGLGMVYNFTGKNNTSFLFGKNVNGVTKAFNSNADTFGVKKLTRNDVKRILNNLIKEGWLEVGDTYTERQEFNGKVVETKLTELTISESGMILIRKAIWEMNNQEVPQKLF